MTKFHIHLGNSLIKIVSLQKLMKKRGINEEKKKERGLGNGGSMDILEQNAYTILIKYMESVFSC